MGLKFRDGIEPFGPLPAPMRAGITRRDERRPPALLEETQSVQQDAMLKALLQRTAQGEKAAFQALYGALYAALMRFLYRATGSVPDAEDLVNEVMLVVWRNACHFRGESQVTTSTDALQYNSTKSGYSGYHSGDTEQSDGDYLLSEQWEWDFNAGYSQVVDDNWQWTLSHAWIERERAKGNSDQDYQEWRVNLFFRDYLSVLFAYSDDYRGAGWPAYTTEWAWSVPLGSYVDFDLGAGWTDGIGGRDNQYGYGWLGVGGDLAWGWKPKQGLLQQPPQWRVRCYHSGSAADTVLGENRAGTQWEILLTVPLRLNALSSR
jgi:hypothetical protein